MNNSNTSSSVSIGTELNSTTENNQSGGGWLTSLFGSTSASCASEWALHAFNDNLPQVACYILSHELFKSQSSDCSLKDKFGRSILHHLIVCCKDHVEAKQVLLSVLNTKDAKKNLNVQDVKLNTPSHYAMYLQQYDILELLENLGADLTLKNKDGLSIAPKQHSTSSHLTNDSRASVFMTLTAPKTSESCRKSGKKSLSDDDDDDDDDVGNEVYSEKDDEKLSNIIKTLFKVKEIKPVSDLDTIGFTFSESSARKPVGNRARIPVLSEEHNMLESADSVDVLNAIMREFRNANGAEVHQLGGGKKQDNNGTRKMITYSEMSTNASDTNTSYTSIGGSPSLSRQDDRASDAHKNSIVKIKEILNVSDDEARAYKALLWDQIKKENENMTNLDKSMELEKRASDSKVLESFDKNYVVNMMTVIKKKYEEKKLSSNTSNSSKSNETSSEESEKPKRKSKAKK